MEVTLDELAKSVSEARDIESLTRSILKLMEAVTGLESTYLTRIDEEAGMQHVLFSRNSQALEIPEGLSVPWGDTLCKRALEQETLFVDDVTTRWGDSEAAKSLGINTYMSQPVFVGSEKLYGTLCAASGNRRSISPATMNVVGLFAEVIGHQLVREFALQELMDSHSQLLSQVSADPLTGIANRRGLKDTLSAMLGRARAPGESVILAFVDLDGFKDINDRYGHDAGDRFLIEVARRLLSSVSSNELVGRYGGDEFVVAGFFNSAAELKSRIEKNTAGAYELSGAVFDYAGPSVGVVSSGPADVTVEDLLARADHAMYQEKRRRKAAGAALNDPVS